MDVHRQCRTCERACCDLRMENQTVALWGRSLRGVLRRPRRPFKPSRPHALARRGRTHRAPAARPKHCTSRQVKPLRSDHAAAAHLPEITSRTSPPPSARDPQRTGVRLGFDAWVAGRCPDSGGACRPRAAPAPKFPINPGVYRRRSLVADL